MSDEKTLCDWTKKDIETKSKKLTNIIKDSKYYCRKCARTASDEKYLCKAIKLK